MTKHCAMEAKADSTRRIAVTFPDLTETLRQQGNDGVYETGYRKGFEEAKKEAAVAIENQQDLQEKFAHAIVEIDRQYREECAGYLCRFLEALTPSFLAEASHSLLNEIIKERLSGGECEIEVRVCPEDFPTLSLNTAEAAVGSSKVKIISDPSLRPAAVAACWCDGAWRFDPKQIRDELIEELKVETTRYTSEIIEGNDGG